MSNNSFAQKNDKDRFLMKDPSPQLVIHVKDKKLGLLGYLVIDSVVANKCSGGIRMASDVSLDEVIYLARAMTLKYAFNSCALGGAKAGIICPENATDEQKKQILESFGRNLLPIIQTIYMPGGDLGVGPEELDIIKRGAGLTPRILPAHQKAGFFTAYGVYSIAKAVIRHLGLKLENSTFAVEGYGNVGRSLVRFIHQGGGKVVAVSTVHGAIFNKDGLDIDRLESLANDYGDKLVDVYKDASKINKSDLFLVDANVLIPGARPWCIHSDNAPHIKAEAVVVAANIAVTPEASKILRERKIIYIPDFVSTAGGILGCSLLNIRYEEEDVLGIMDHAYATRISKLLGLTAQNGIDVETLAKEIANNNSIRRQEELRLKREKKRWFLTKIKEEKNIKPMVERIASALYRKLKWRKILRSKAVDNAYRNAIGDVKYYDSIALDVVKKTN